jgi:hypothetical protein
MGVGIGLPSSSLRGFFWSILKESFMEFLGLFYLDSSRDNIIIVVGSKLRCIPPH